MIADAALSDRLSAIPCPYGDGTASDRIAAIARRYLGRRNLKHAALEPVG